MLYPRWASQSMSSSSLRRRRHDAGACQARLFIGRFARAASLSLPEFEEAQLLLRKAREDADAAAKLAPDGSTADTIVGFHAQQAVEKALKAVLAAFGEDFPWTHDLRYLIERLDDIETPPPSSLHEVRVLAPWAVEFRYGETIDDPLDRKQAVALAKEAVEWARNQVEATAGD
jgi:HEPN domain-containing protein